MDWNVETIKLSEVNPSDLNPRKISSKQKKGLEASIDKFGYVDLIIYNKQTGNIVGGHQRYQILVKKGVEEAQMLVVDLPPEEEFAANLTMNNPKIEGDWDEPIQDLLSQLESSDADFFSQTNLNDLQTAVEKMAPSTEESCETKCPCCGYEWEASDEDVRLMTLEEQAEMQRGNQ